MKKGGEKIVGASNVVELGPYRSKFAKRARDINPGVLAALSIDSVILQICDVLVAVSAVLTDSKDLRSLPERLEGLFSGIDEDTFRSGLSEIMEGRTQASIELWVRKLRTKAYRIFARRLVGAAAYHQLKSALYQDTAEVSVAVRKGLRSGMPFLVAWEDAIAVMSREQLSKLTPIDVLGLNFTKLLHQFDTFLGEKVLDSFPADISMPQIDELGDLSEMAGIFRQSVSSRTLLQVSRVNEPLVRKLAGARDALEHSADGVAQAASSLVELIDRILRESFDQEQVLNWIEKELPVTSGLWYETDQGEQHPTKRGEVLCLLYNCGSIKREPSEQDDGTGPLFLHQVLAGVVVSARSSLQKLKHSDDADDEDRKKLTELLSAVEGALMLGVLHQQMVPSVAEDCQGLCQNTA